MRARSLVLAGIVGVLLATGAAVLIVTSDHENNKGLTVALAVTASLSFVASGLVALWRRPGNRTGVYLVAVGYLWPLGALTDANEGWVFGLGVVLANLAFIPFVMLVLAYPTGTLNRRFDRAFTLATTALVVGFGTAIVLLTDTPIRTCDDCPQNALALVEAPRIARVFDWTANAIVIVLVATLLVVVARRWRAASPALRRTLAPVIATGSVALILIGAATVVNSISGNVAGVLELAFLIAFACVPIAFLVGVLRSRLARASAARLLLDLSGGMALRDALARALADPSLSIAYHLQERQTWVDSEGHTIDPPERTPLRAATLVEREGRQIAALVHDPALDDQPDLLQAITTAAGLWLENELLQAELRAQYQFLETIVNTAPSLLCVVDADGRIQNFNTAVKVASGLDDPEQIRGRDFWDVFISEHERPEIAERFRAAGPEFAASEYENTFIDAKGNDRVIAWQAAPLRDEHGRVSRIIAGGIDITERKQRELQLQKERDITDTLMQAIPSIVVVVDDEAVIVDSGVDDTRAGVNGAFREMLGWPDELVVRRSMLDFVDAEDAYLARMAIASAANGLAAPERESRWIRADGERVVVAWTATPVADVTGRRTSLVLVSGIEVTERKRHEEEIRASRARIVAAADEARRRLERNLHDGAQQRLVALSVSLRLAEAKLETDPDGARGILTAAREELSSALDELRELARGIHPAVLTDRGLQAAVEAIVGRFPLPVELDVPAERPSPAIEAAAYYVVSEALANVTKYAAASSVRVRIAEAEGWVIVEVADDGIGGADPLGGTGLRGLSDRVAALDGTLRIESPSDGGTRVVAEIPVRDPALAT